jgi:hypothetical protein
MRWVKQPAHGVAIQAAEVHHALLSVCYVVQEPSRGICCENAQ